MAKFRLKELVLKVFGPLGGCGWSGNGCLFREAVGRIDCGNWREGSVNESSNTCFGKNEC